MECMKELPYFMYPLLEEVRSNPCNSEKPHASWKSPAVQKESEVLFQELCGMKESRNDPVQQFCILLMGYSRYRVDAAIWLHSMELLLCKYCN